MRFDGFTFKLFTPVGPGAGAGPTVLGVSADADGSLWARLRGPALVRYRGGAFEQVRLTDDVSGTVVTAMTRRRDGSPLFTPISAGVVSWRDGRVDRIASPTVLASSFVIAMIESSDGEIWLGTRDAGLLRVRGARVAPIGGDLPDSKVNCLIEGEPGELWIGTDRGVARVIDGVATTEGVPAAVARLPALAMLRDRDGNIWMAMGAQGVFRVNRHGAAAVDSWDARTRGNATALFEDRDGLIWIGTTRGLERLRDGVFTTWSGAQGLLVDAIGPVHVDPASGDVWFAPVDGGLYRLADQRIEAITEAGLAGDVVYSIAGGDGELWLGRQRGGLMRLRTSGAARSVAQLTQADGLAQNSVYSVIRARDGSIWAGTLSAGVSRYANGRFTTWTAADGLASNTVAAMLETAEGALWFGTPNGLSTMSGGVWRRLTVREGLPSNDINTLYEDVNRNVWVGTAAGLAVRPAGGALRAVTTPASLRAPIFGIAEDTSGGLWVATADRVLRTPRTRLVAGATLSELDVREYGLADGLTSTEGVKRHRSMAADGRGRIWLATRLGLSAATIARAVSSAPPALAQIEDVAADAAALDLRADTVRVPAGAQRIRVSFTGLSFAVPERVRFRFRLDGFDRAWSEPGAARQTVYTNLPPGPYRFRVTASNSDGAWTGREATLSFIVSPAYWQTTWFRFSIAVLVLAGAWGLYRLRLLQLSRRLTVRFEERLAERTRIAQDLHDTLLQGFLSASMQLHVVADRVADDSPAKAPLARVLQLMTQVVEEGRNAVRGLRSTSAEVDDLEQAFCRIPAEVASEREVLFRVIVEGQPRRLHPLIRDDVHRIGREAAMNAYRHAEAAHIEVELEYTSRHLRLLVRDDGRGIDEEVLRSGRDGHWGLSGMRERAERIGARLEVWSRAGAGSEVALLVPNHVAFQESAASDARASWWRRLLRRS